jgi:hypothetical protein
LIDVFPQFFRLMAALSAVGNVPNHADPIIARVSGFPARLRSTDPLSLTTSDNRHAAFVSLGSPCMIDLLDCESLHFADAPITIDFAFRPTRAQLHRGSSPFLLLFCALAPRCSLAIVDVHTQAASVYVVDPVRQAFASIFCPTSNSVSFLVDLDPIVEIAVQQSPFAVASYSVTNTLTFRSIHGCFGSGETLFIVHDSPQKVAVYDLRTRTFFTSKASLPELNRFIFCETAHGPSLILFGLTCEPVQIGFPNGSVLSIQGLLRPSFFTNAFADDFGIFFLSCGRIAYTVLSEIPLQQPQLRSFGRSTVVLTVPTLFRGTFARSAAVVLTTGEKVALLRLPIPQTVQFTLPPLRAHSASVEVLFDGVWFRSPPLEFTIPLAELPQCRHFSAFAVDDDTVRLEWRRPDGIPGAVMIEGGSESIHEWTPIVLIADEQVQTVHLRVDPSNHRFRVFVVDEDGNKGIPAMTERKKLSGDGIRHRFTREQSQVLVSFFDECDTPTRAQREHLAHHLHIPLQSITYWFQNARKRRTF